MPRKKKDLGQDLHIHAAFGRAVRAIRTERFLSQEQLAERAHLDQTYLSGIERGVRNPTLRVISRIAEGLETSLPELFRVTEVERTRDPNPKGDESQST